MAYYRDSNGNLVKIKDNSNPESKETKKKYFYVRNGNGDLAKKEVSESYNDPKKFQFFKAGAFEDGYQFGDVTKSVGSTVVDVGAGAVKGVLGMGEGLVDAAKYGVAGVADLVGADSFADDVRVSARKNTVDDWFAPMKESAIERNSMLGKTGDAVSESLGQIATLIVTGGLGAAAGLGGTGVSALTAGTMFASSAGSGISEAYNSGKDVTDAQAYTYGLSKGAIDAVSEMIFGGLGKSIKALGISRGITSIDDVFAKKLSSKISNHALRNFAQFGVKASAEGLEEVIASHASAVAKYFTYMSDEDLKQLVKDENALEQFVVGALASGIAQAPGYKASVKNGTDFVTGLTASEEAVIEAEVDRIVKEKGTKGKDREKVYDEVKKALERGYIDTDTIEGTLGGETYKEYKALTDKQTKLRKEYAEADDSRKAELENQLAEINAQASKLRERLDVSMADYVRGTKLAESYNEKARRGQKFEADLSRYTNEYAKKTVQNFMEHTESNNTNRTHDFIDLLAKVSEDREHSFEFMTTAQIEESIKNGNPYGINADPSKIEAFVSGKDKTIIINMDAKKSLSSLVGHETTHTLESAGVYDALQEAVFKYAKTKKEYADRLASIQRRYKGADAAYQNKELTADLLGDYLFSDPDFIKSLSTERPNIFKRIFNEIKYLYKMATAGSAEAKELERVKHLFEKAWAESSKASAETKYSTKDNFDIDDFDIEPISDEEWHKLLDDSGYTVSEKTKTDASARTKDRYKGDTSRNGKVAKLTDERIGRLFKEYGASNPTYAQAYITSIHPRDFLSLTLKDESFEKWDKTAQEGTDSELYPLNEEELRNQTQTPFLIIDSETGEVTGHEGRHRMRALLEADVTDVPIAVIDYRTKHSKKKEASMRLTSQEFYEGPVNDNFTTEVRNLIPINEVHKDEIMSAYGGEGDIRYSLSDSDGKHLTEGQQEFFKDSKVRDENGNLMVMYHGSMYDFTVFEDKAPVNGRVRGDGFYFTENKKHAANWGKKAYGGKVYKVYLDIKNPFVVSSTEPIPTDVMEALKEQEGRLYDSLSSHPGWWGSEYTREEFIKSESSRLFKDTASALTFLEDSTEVLKSLGYDGIVVMNESSNDNWKGMKYQEVIAFDSNQIKRVNNANPTSNPDIRYSLTDSDGSEIETDRVSQNEYDVKYSLAYSEDIAQGQRSYVDSNRANAHVTMDDLKKAQDVTRAMVDVMMKYSSILPEDKIGKVLTKNGSYDISVENTTICVRTLAYNEFVDKVQEELGRPMTQMESFLVSQKLYDIATDPQCLYCYVSLDRKAFNDMLLRYMSERDTVIEKYRNSDRTPETVSKLYEEFLNGRKDTKQMKGRFNKWISYVDNDTPLLSLADISTESRQSKIKLDGGSLAEQLKDARQYAQSASWSKIQKNYVAYKDEILRLSDKAIRDLNKHYGLRWYSFSDYSPAFIVENMQQITDAAIRGLKGLSYTKDTDFAEIFAPSGMNINISVFVNADDDGNFYIDERQSADFEKAKALREKYPNVGIVATVTNDEALRWAASQEWSDVIIPFHIVRTGTDVAEYYKWLNYTGESGDKIGDADLWDAYLDSLNVSENARKKVSKNIYPSEHKNNKDTYLSLCESRGLTPRFARFAGEDWYMKLVNETRLSADESVPLRPIYNEDVAKASFERFVGKGGYEGGWYQDGVDVDAEVGVVADDIRAGKKANEVDYGRQDGYAPVDIMASRKKNRQHSRNRIADDDLYAPIEYGNYNTYARDIALEGTVSEDFAPVADDLVQDVHVDEPEEVAPDDLPLSEKVSYYERELDRNQQLLDESQEKYDRKIAELQSKLDSKKDQNSRTANGLKRSIERMKRLKDSVYIDYARKISNLKSKIAQMRAEGDQTKRVTRPQLHKSIVDRIKKRFAESGLDFDRVLKRAKDLATFRTVDNTPQRVMEKALGYKEGQILSDLTVNQVAQNETEGIKWLSSFTDRKNGLLAQISKQYGIKPGSKESAAAQMYAEGFYVDENNDIISYGDAELAQDFPNRTVQENIKALARDGRIRQIYDETLRMINESRVRNAYPEIPRLDNYFLHFRAMDDTFSRLGLPFNPNDIRAKDLPTDLNGVTADLKPGQPYFASAMHRTGKRTSFDLLGGLERYLTAAKNQIYHIDDIQTLRALRNYIADTYGQAHGLEGLDEMSEEEVQERIKEVYGSHLSTFAKFLNEEANILAGKTSLIDRGLEGIIGRRGITFLNEMNKQVGSNMVGLNVSSSLTNILPVIQTIAKTNKADFVKAFAQTVSNKIGGIFGRNDGFAEQSPVIIRRKGADRFHRNPWQIAGDFGYSLMSAVDNISTELIARAKYNELTRKGMDSQQAHFETDKWVSRLMGDRSLGQMPHLFNSKMLGLVTKFQLEVRNQLDSQFYDTIQETKASNEDIQNGLERNARTAAKVVSTFVQLAVLQHLFGKAFESVAGYNPAFDILGVLIKAFGFDDDEEKEDTPLDNVEQAFFELVEDLPYTSTLTGGRIPIASALPVEQFITGKDDYGNEKSRKETLLEAAPYWLWPTGYGQYKKTKQGLGMFDDDLPIVGSYTDSGNLRFSVEDTLQNRVQAGLFGQWASSEARDYFDNERSPLREKQIEELVELDLPIRDYWEYREGLAKQETLEDKFEYINAQPVTTEQKNIMINNVVDRKNPVDMASYDSFSGYEEFDFYTKNPEKYSFLEANGISYVDYVSSEEAKKEYDSAYTWSKDNPEKVKVAKAVTDSIVEYRRYARTLNDIRADKDANGNPINGSAKQKKIAFIESLDIDYGAKLILYRNEYKTDNSFNNGLLEYLYNRDDIPYIDKLSILRELGFTIDRDGTVRW